MTKDKTHSSKVNTSSVKNNDVTNDWNNTTDFNEKKQVYYIDELRDDPKKEQEGIFD